MAKQKLEVVVSDLSGEDIPEGTGAVVRISFAAGSVYVLDVTTEEADVWATQGREQKKRGRPKKTVPNYGDLDLEAEAVA